MSVEAASAFVRGELIESGLVPGAVLAKCSISGRSVEGSAIGVDALGEPLAETSLFATYCMGKPILAAVVLSLVSHREVSLDDRIGDLMPCGGSVGALTVDQCLRHRVCIDVPDGLEALLLPQEEFERKLRHAGATAATPPRYSEYTSWLLLGRALEAMTGRALDDLVVDLVVQPLRLNGMVALGDESWLAARRRVNGWMACPHRFIPLLVEETGWLNWRRNPGFGGYMTVAGSLLLLTSGAFNASIPADRRVESDAPVVHSDAVLQRDCAFGLGVFTDLHTFGLTDLASVRSYGQFGLMGMSGVVVVPDNDVAIGYQLAGCLDVETMDGWVRPEIVRRLLLP